MNGAKRHLLPLLSAVLLTGCATKPAVLPTAPAVPVTCAVEPAQRFVGTVATADVGAELLRLTGARALRWAPPRTAVTMDFRGDRLTVSYSDDYVISAVSCG